jgi:nitroreductase
MSQIDCGLLGENMILSAWSMGIGSCCLGSPIRFMKTEPQVADYLKRLNIPEGYELLYCIAFGYPDESPAAKPRDASKVMFVE